MAVSKSCHPLFLDFSRVFLFLAFPMHLTFTWKARPIRQQQKYIPIILGYSTLLNSFHHSLLNRFFFAARKTFGLILETWREMRVDFW
jgi:hypothetical protein